MAYKHNTLSFHMNTYIALYKLNDPHFSLITAPINSTTFILQWGNK